MKRDLFNSDYLWIKIVVALLFLLFVGFLCACGSVDRKTQTSSMHQTDGICAENTDWEKCTVRVVNYAIGTEFYVLRSNGEFGIYGTPAICSLDAFNQQKQDIKEILSGSLSKEKKEELNTIIAKLNYKGKMLSIPEADENAQYRIERIDVFVSVDDSEEAHFLKNYDSWEGYPQIEYDELIRFISGIFPSSAVLVR